MRGSVVRKPMQNYNKTWVFVKGFYGKFEKIQLFN